MIQNIDFFNEEYMGWLYGFLISKKIMNIEIIQILAQMKMKKI